MLVFWHLKYKSRVYKQDNQVFYSLKKMELYLKRLLLIFHSVTKIPDKPPKLYLANRIPRKVLLHRLSTKIPVKSQELYLAKQILFKALLHKLLIKIQVKAPQLYLETKFSLKALLVA